MSIETYREEQESNVGERIMEQLNKIVGADVFSISEDEETMESMMDDDSGEEDEPYDPNEEMSHNL